jgi:hypothetical protein
MRELKYLKFGLIVLVSLIYQSLSVSSTVNYDDDWIYSYSTFSDGVAWGGYDMASYATGYSTSYADCLCWDWCDDGSTDSTVTIWDTCYCKTSDVQADCESYYSIVNNVCNVMDDCWVENLGNGHDINTGASGDRWECYQDIREFKDCDNSQGQRGVVDHSWDAYQIVYPKKYSCDGEYFDTKGSVDGTLWKTWDDNRVCSSPYERCDTNSAHDNHDNQLAYTATGTIPNPCSLKDGANSNYECSWDDECWSDNCGESVDNDYKYLCNSDGADSYEDQSLAVHQTCGGTGYSTGWSSGESTYYCSIAAGAGYVCDTEHDEQTSTWPSTPSSPCKKNIDQTCSQTTDCWNDDGGNWCNSISQCTNGANGRSCGGSSDCTSNYCCDGTCAASACIGETDLAILEVTPIQVIPHVDMVKGKSGYVRVIVHNYGLFNATALVSVTFDGTPLPLGNATKLIINGSNETFDFDFIPDVIGNNKIISANITIVN